MSVWSKILCLALAVTSSQATAEPYYRNGHWFVTESYGSCTLFATFSSDRWLWINYNSDLDRAQVSLTSSSFASVKPKDKFLVRVDFVKGESFSKQYEIRTFEGNLSLIKPGITDTFEGFLFLRYMEEADILAFTLSDKTLLASLNMQGSAGAVFALRECADAEAIQSPSDPLKGNAIPNFSGRD